MRQLRQQEGLAAVELVLILPFLMVFVLGFVNLGSAYSIKTDETHLANQAARIAATNDCPVCKSAGQTVNTYVLAGAASKEVRDHATIKVTFASQLGAPVTGNHCAGQPVTVQVELLNYKLLPLGGLAAIPSIHATSTARLESSWRGDATTGLHSANDIYDVEPGSASPDVCP